MLRLWLPPEFCQANEFEVIARGLREIETEISDGKFVWDQSLEDVHMNIEATLTKRIGPAGAKLHTARSRNDQIALDLRLYVREEIDKIVIRLRALQNALLLLAQKHSDIIMPGYTHISARNRFIWRITFWRSSKR